MIEPVNGYIHHVFSPGQREATVRAMLGVADEVNVSPDRTADAERRLTQAKTKLSRFQQAIEAGADPAALVEPLNRAKAERDAAEEELARLPVGVTIDRAEVEAMVDSLAVVGRQVMHASPARLQELYGEIGLEMLYNANERMVNVTIRPPRRVSACVRGGLEPHAWEISRFRGDHAHQPSSATWLRPWDRVCGNSTATSRADRR